MVRFVVDQLIPPPRLFSPPSLRLREVIIVSGKMRVVWHYNLPLCGATLCTPSFTKLPHVTQPQYPKTDSRVLARIQPQLIFIPSYSSRTVA